MFTGIIEELGEIASFTEQSDGARLEIRAEKVVDGTLEGDSISVNGVCLTALQIGKKGFAADVSTETLNCSTLGRLKKGDAVNLERAVTPATRLGGHIVQGHVDCRGEFVSAVGEGDFRTVTISYPPEIGRYLVNKGSVTVEGISLTIADLTDTSFAVAVIPKTWEMTNLSSLEPGDPVNLEVDVMAKYVERLLGFENKTQGGAGITIEKLKRLGIA